MAAGLSRETFFKPSSASPSGDLDISVVSSYVSQRKQVFPAVEGRIKIYNSAAGRQRPTPLLVSLVSLVLLWRTQS